MNADRNRVERPLLVGGLLLVGIVGIGSFAPRSPDRDLTFGIEPYRHLGPLAFALAAGAVLALLAVPGLAAAVARPFAAAGRRIPAAAAIPLAAAAFALAGFVLPNYTLSGDAGSVVLMAASGVVHPSNALTCWLFRATELLVGPDPVLAIRLVSALSGAVFAGSAVAIARECAPPGPRRAGVAAALLFTGTAALFLGTIEVYPPLVAAIAVYLLLGIRWLGGRGRGFAPPLALGVAFCLHGSAALLLPTLLLLANRGVFRPIAWRRGLLFAGLFLVPVLVTAAGVVLVAWDGVPPEGGTERYGTFLGTEGEGPLLPLVRTRENPRQPYAILDLEHAAGVANLYLLLAPVGIVLLLGGRRPWREARFRFVGLAALALLALPNVWNVSYTLRRDWDLFSSLGVPLALLGGLAWFGTDRSAASVARVAALSLFLTLGFAVSNHARPWARYGYAIQLRDALAAAVPRAAADAAVEDTMRRAAEEGLSAPDGRRVRLGRELETGAVEALQSLRALEPDAAEIEPERLRRALARELSALPPAVAEGAAAALVADVELVLRLSREQGRKNPPPGPLAAIVVRGTRGRPDFSRLGPAAAGEERDVHLLDALDAVFAREEGYRRYRSPPGYADLADALAPRVADVEIGGERLPRAERWVSILAVALARVMAPAEGDDRPRWAALAARADEYDRVAARLEPGREAALERTEWLSGLPDLSPEERYRTVRRWAEHALETSPDDPGWLYILGAALYHEGEKEEAIEVLRRAVDASPIDLSARMNLALALRDAGRSAEAMAIAERALRFDPWSARAPWALIFLAELHQQRGNRETAVALLESAARLAERASTPEVRAAIRERVEQLLAPLGTRPGGG